MRELIQQWPLEWVAALFVLAALVIGVAGTRLTRVADRLADITGLGEAMFGAVMLGAVTSLAGIVTSVSTAWNGFGELAVSNAIGGIAVQTAFLSVADLAYRRANLEHAAASPENMFQAVLLVLMLTMPLMVHALPAVSVFAVHPLSVLLLVVYAAGLRMTRRVRTAPSWRSERTADTVEDQPQEQPPGPAEQRALWVRFAVLAAAVSLAGYSVGQLGIVLVVQAGVSETVVGALLTAVVTSIPELVTSVAAVRQGALTLAVGGIIGGNAFDVLFLSFADFAFRDGSLYHAMSVHQVFLITLAIVMTAVLLMGMLRRERKGIANIGFESAIVIVLYLFGAVLLSAA